MNQTTQLHDADLHGQDASMSTETPASASDSQEPMFRTRLGTPSYMVQSKRGMPQRVLLGAGVAVPVIGGAAGAWFYLRRKRRNRPGARMRRMLEQTRSGLAENPRTSLGGGLSVLVLLALLRRLMRRSHKQPVVQPEVDVATLRELRQRIPPVNVRRMPPGVLVAMLGVGLVVLWRWRRKAEEPMYIGTPGVESASGRDRVGSGELPPDYASEYPNRAR